MTDKEYQSLFVKCAVMKDREKKLYKRLLYWLGYDGIFFFEMLIQEYGSISKAHWMDNGIPHHVHFREGMIIRNFLRRQKYTRHWNSHRLDNEWMGIVTTALKLCRLGNKQLHELLRYTGEYEEF
jgi:hypothetical protein